MGQQCSCNGDDEAWKEENDWDKLHTGPVPHTVKDRVSEVRAFVEALPDHKGLDASLPDCLQAVASRSCSAQALKTAGLEAVFALKKRAVAISSITDSDDYLAASFKEKAQEVLYPPDCQEDALVRWLQEGLGIGWACKKGLKSGVPNQDNFSVLAVEGSFILLGVYDGHGPKGHHISQLARELIVRNFLDHPLRETDTEAAFHETFLKAQEEIKEKCGQKASNSGTTVTMVYVDWLKLKFTVAHVGDTRSVLGWRHRPDDDGAVANGKFEVDEITVDHHPHLEQERRRIESASPPGRVIFDGHVNYRVFSQNGMYPGLNMSRALGDIVGHEEAGISAVPDTRTIDLKPLLCESDMDVMLFICSDGVWEFMQSSHALLMAASSAENGTQAIANRLAVEGWDRWIADSCGEGSDDITSVCIRLDVALPKMQS